MNPPLIRKFSKVECVHFEVGIGCTIHESVQITGAQKVIIGDHCLLGPGVRIIGGEFTLGDYSKIHNGTYIYPQKYVRMGHLTWIGQGTTLDGTGGITAGNYLGVGINSALYSHIRHGDITEGCRFDQNKEMVIGNDVWFVGMCLVSPVNAGDKSVAFLGSVITKDMRTNHVYGGNPAVDLTEKIGAPWRTVPAERKLEIMQRYLAEFSECAPNDFESDSLCVVYNMPSSPDDRTYYDISTRTFTKRNSPSEIAFNKWLFPYKAKFSPT